MVWAFTSIMTISLLTGMILGCKSTSGGGESSGLNSELKLETSSNSVIDRDHTFKTYSLSAQKTCRDFVTFHSATEHPTIENTENRAYYDLMMHWAQGFIAGVNYRSEQTKDILADAGTVVPLSKLVTDQCAKTPEQNLQTAVLHVVASLTLVQHVSNGQTSDGLPGKSVRYYAVLAQTVPSATRPATKLDPQKLLANMDYWLLSDWAFGFFSGVNAVSQVSSDIFRTATTKGLDPLQLLRERTKAPKANFRFSYLVKTLATEFEKTSLSP